MAARDPLVDGNEIQFDLIDRAERGDPMLPMAAAANRTMEPVDQFLAEQGAFGAGPQLVTDQMGQRVMAIQSLGDQLANMRMDAVDARWPVDEETLLNFSFKNGHHYVEVDRARRGVVALPAPRGLVRRKVAKFEPWFRAHHGQLSEAEPQAGIVPLTRSQDDRDAAAFAERLRTWLQPRIYGFQKRSQNTMWMLLAGTATYYMGTTWEPDPLYEQATGFKHRPDLESEILSPMQCWCDNRSSCIDDMRWFGRDIYLPEAEARAAYLKPEQQNSLITEAEAVDPEQRGFWTLRNIQNLLGREDPWGRITGSGTPSNRLTMEEQEVVICEFWGRKGIAMQGAFFDGLEGVPGLTVEVLEGAESGRTPLVRFPNGLRVRFSPDGYVLEIRDNHTPMGELPFREFKLTQSAGYWATAWATPLRWINQAFDWVISLREEHLLRTAHPAFLDPKEARVSRRATSSGTTLRIRYRANRFNAKPEWANPPSMPSDIVQFLEYLNQLWMEISGRHEVSQGTLPARLSGVAVSLLQEADAAQFGFAGNELEDGYRSILRMALLNIKAFFPENDPRLVKLAGDAPYKLQAFMAADLDDDLDIQVQKGSGVPKSASVVKQTALELFQAGALIDPITKLPDTRKLMEVFEFGSTDSLYGEDELDRQNARDEEEAILNLNPLLAQALLEQFVLTGVLPEPFTVSPYDNHVVHEMSHRMKLKEIESDPRVHPLCRKLLELHWTLTVQGALPVLIQTTPEIAAAFLPNPMAGGQGGGEDGADSESDSDSDDTNDEAA